MKKNKILITAVLMFLFTMCLAPITTFAATEIGDIEIENVKLITIQVMLPKQMLLQWVVGTVYIV